MRCCLANCFLYITLILFCMANRQIFIFFLTFNKCNWTHSYSCSVKFIYLLNSPASNRYHGNRISQVLISLTISLKINTDFDMQSTEWFKIARALQICVRIWVYMRFHNSLKLIKRFHSFKNEIHICNISFLQLIHFSQFKSNA